MLARPSFWQARACARPRRSRRIPRAASSCSRRSPAFSATVSTARAERSRPTWAAVIDRDFTPASLAATMWNHAPAMWAAMREREIRAGDLDEQAAGDLFAYFYSARFFEKPGDAGARQAPVPAKHGCGMPRPDRAKASGAKPVSQWESLADPWRWPNAMWNHAPRMRREPRARNIALARAERAGPDRHAGLSPEPSRHAPTSLAASRSAPERMARHCSNRRAARAAISPAAALADRSKARR